MSDRNLFEYVLRLADDRFILSCRLSELCGHGPILEEDLALTNIALDLLGEADSLYGYAADIKGEGVSSDSLAYLRTEREYKNVLLVEQDNDDFAHTIVRQFLFDAFDYYFCSELCQSKDERLVAIAQKSIKEITYHLRHSSSWIIKLGDGTEQSHKRMQTAIDNLWMYTGELFAGDNLDDQFEKTGIAPNLDQVKSKWDKTVSDTFKEAGLNIPENDFAMMGGRDGRHSEALGHILSDIQYLGRLYPGASWD
jgi:ring-1,2-phenylacetyl-CoA epoxidase subunit PaaC